MLSEIRSTEKLLAVLKLEWSCILVIDLTSIRQPLHYVAEKRAKWPLYDRIITFKMSD